jgi:hypothetical protein
VWWRTTTSEFVYIWGMTRNVNLNHLNQRLLIHAIAG